MNVNNIVKLLRKHGFTYKRGDKLWAARYERGNKTISVNVQLNEVWDWKEHTNPIKFNNYNDLEVLLVTNTFNE